MFRSEGGKSSLQEAAVEIHVVGNDKHYPVEQVVYGAIIDAATGGLLVTTEAMVAEKPEKKTPPAMPPGGGMDGF
jgi:hypothetical protein